MTDLLTWEDGIDCYIGKLGKNEVIRLEIDISKDFIAYCVTLLLPSYYRPYASAFRNISIDECRNKGKEMAETMLRAWFNECGLLVYKKEG